MDEGDFRPLKQDTMAKLVKAGDCKSLIPGSIPGGVSMEANFYGVKCLMCGEEIYSLSMHDFVRCFCGNIFVDGGQEGFTRYGAFFVDKMKNVEAYINETGFNGVIKDDEYTLEKKEKAKAHIKLLSR